MPKHLQIAPPKSVVLVYTCLVRTSMLIILYLSEALFLSLFSFMCSFLAYFWPSFIFQLSIINLLYLILLSNAFV